MTAERYMAVGKGLDKDSPRETRIVFPSRESALERAQAIANATGEPARVVRQEMNGIQWFDCESTPVIPNPEADAPVIEGKLAIGQVVITLFPDDDIAVAFAGQVPMAAAMSACLQAAHWMLKNPPALHAPGGPPVDGKRLMTKEGP